MLLTVLGEYVLPMREAVWQETLVTSLEALDHRTQSARQALARSVAGGWLARERHGRRSRVSLTSETAEILAAGAERIYSFGEDRPWDGRWLVVILRVPEERRDIRHRFRTRLAWAGFGSLGGGVWIAPHADRDDAIRVPSEVSSAVELVTFRAELARFGIPPDRRRGVGPRRGQVEYDEFVRAFARLRPKTPEAVFRAQTMLVHEWRKFPFLDPDLPGDLLPGRWPRARAREVFQERHAAWHGTAQDYFRSLEALPAAA